MNKIVIIFLFFICFFPPAGNSQNKGSGFSFLDKGLFFEPLLLDPFVPLPAAGIHAIIHSDGDEFKGIYIPVTMGFQQSFIRYALNGISAIELGLESAAYTQFQVQKWDENTYLGEMINTDYRVSGFLNYKTAELVVQLKIYHQSSHLADDYLLRNSITSPNPGTMNYEQADLNLSYNTASTRIYGGAGYIFNPNNIRKRVSFQTGVFYRKHDRHNSGFRLVTGADIKLQEQHRFRPSMKFGAGLEMGLPGKTNLCFLGEYYNGHLPFSVLEYNLITWIGLTSIIIFPAN